MSDILTSLPEALRDFCAAIKASGFYPSDHPAVTAATGKALGRLQEALAEEGALKIGVGDAVFLLDGRQFGGEDPVLGGLATYLGRRRIGLLIFQSPLEIGALQGLLEVITLDPATLRSRGGAARCLAEKRLGGVSLADFDPAETLRGAVTASGTGSGSPRGEGQTLSMNELVSRFLISQDVAAPSGATTWIIQAARDEQAARRLLREIQSIAGTTGSGRGQALTSALGRMAAEVARADPGALPALAVNLGAALEDLDPAGRMEVLRASIPVPGTDIDFAREMRDRISDDKLTEMIATLVRSEGKMTPRLATVVRKVFIDSGRMEGSRGEILEAIKAARQPGADPLAEVWNSIENLLEEAQDEWLSREYRSLLERVGTEAPRVDEALRREIQALPGFMEALTKEGTGRRAWQILADLVQLDSTSPHVCGTLCQIEKGADGIDFNWYSASAEVTTTVRHLIDSAPPPRVREASLKTLNAICARVIASYPSGFHDMNAGHHEALARIFEALGPYGVEPLIVGLRQEEDWEIRKTFIALLAARGRQAVEVLQRHLDDPSWYVVRNMLLALGEVGDPSAVPAIGSCLKHPEPRVRREAVSALGRIGGPRAFPLVVVCMDDPEIAETAARCLAAINRPRTVSTLLQMTDRVSLFGRRSGRLKEAIKTLGALRAPESIPRLQTILMRNLWIPPSSGDSVRIAAALALEKIGTPDARRVVERGVRLWRHSVRSACATIVEGRQPSS